MKLWGRSHDPGNRAGPLSGIHLNIFHPGRRDRDLGYRDLRAVDMGDGTERLPGRDDFYPGNVIHIMILISDTENTYNHRSLSKKLSENTKHSKTKSIRNGNIRKQKASENKTSENKKHPETKKYENKTSENKKHPKTKSSRKQNIRKTARIDA